MIGSDELKHISVYVALLSSGDAVFDWNGGLLGIKNEVQVGQRIHVSGVAAANAINFDSIKSPGDAKMVAIYDAKEGGNLLWLDRLVLNSGDFYNPSIAMHS